MPDLKTQIVDYARYASDLKLCDKCLGTGKKREHRTNGVCNFCWGTGQRSKDNEGKPIVWYRGEWRYPQR